PPGNSSRSEGRQVSAWRVHQLQDAIPHAMRGDLEGDSNSAFLVRVTSDALASLMAVYGFQETGNTRDLKNEESVFCFPAAYSVVDGRIRQRTAEFGSQRSRHPGLRSRGCFHRQSAGQGQRAIPV